MLNSLWSLSHFVQLLAQLMSSEEGLRPAVVIPAGYFWTQPRRQIQNFPDVSGVSVLIFKAQLTIS